MTTSIDEDVTMQEANDVPPLPSVLKGKGKGKATDVVAYAEEDDLLPWVEKYRPVTMNDLVSHKDITSTLERFIEKNRLPHLLFYGPPGTGKTSTILAMARRIYGSNYKNNVLELNASDDRGIDVVREQIKSFASTRNVFAAASTSTGGFKLIVLDEADAMTQAAQGALRRVIEQYTKNVRFCIICNYVNKIIPAIQSRCTRFRFNPLELDQVEGRLDHVIQSEGCKLTADGKDALIKLSRGDMRRALNVLQACHAAYDTIDEAAVYNCTGAPQPADIEEMVNSMMTDEFTTSYTKITTMKASKGLALTDMITSIYDLLMTVKLPPAARVYLLDHLASTEHRLSTGGSEKMQLTALLGAVKLAVEISKKAEGK
ncbi:P-loop containing nucleoside triphosphate hydrolase protein [Tilletiaria anomala UBC 951]|uniref:Replication factor C subunit 3 n=1 Tax=Tilletiaria anomala (strain ATCC 24038 / CBS 436.72 / UBC 951) TaxID=1037660 RepID=A0A066WLD0_TILAU|nr:P-loop containing nucleoside triphosphate hydrolase protein [Tilletiaria anomala UBC 951]KDN53373.1 P-loop containing nucleoside triphosphate hydrolase protein [Tilletiaria anomala UBC 951]